MVQSFFSCFGAIRICLKQIKKEVLMGLLKIVNSYELGGIITLIIILYYLLFFFFFFCLGPLGTNMHISLGPLSCPMSICMLGFQDNVLSQKTLFKLPLAPYSPPLHLFCYHQVPKLYVQEHHQLISQYCKEYNLQFLNLGF